MKERILEAGYDTQRQFIFWIESGCQQLLASLLWRNGVGSFLQQNSFRVLRRLHLTPYMPVLSVMNILIIGTGINHFESNLNGQGLVVANSYLDLEWYVGHAKEIINTHKL